MVLYVHAKHIRYTDYGEYVGHVDGIAWSTDDEYPQGFEQGRTVADALAEAAPYVASGALTILVGHPVRTTRDYNPRGDM